MVWEISCHYNPQIFVGDLLFPSLWKLLGSSHYSYILSSVWVFCPRFFMPGIWGWQGSDSVACLSSPGSSSALYHLNSFSHPICGPWNLHKAGGSWCVHLFLIYCLFLYFFPSILWEISSALSSKPCCSLEFENFCYHLKNFQEFFLIPQCFLKKKKKKIFLLHQHIIFRKKISRRMCFCFWVS